MIVTVRWSVVDLWPFDTTETCVIGLIVMPYVTFLLGWQLHAEWIAR
jgi:hypothetical protein